MVLTILVSLLNSFFKEDKDRGPPSCHATTRIPFNRQIANMNPFQTWRLEEGISSSCGQISVPTCTLAAD